MPGYFLYSSVFYLNPCQTQRKENTDGQDILKLFCLSYVIPDKNLVPDSQLEIKIKSSNSSGSKVLELKSSLPQEQSVLLWASLESLTYGKFWLSKIHRLYPI